MKIKRVNKFSELGTTRGRCKNAPSILLWLLVNLVVK